MRKNNLEPNVLSWQYSILPEKQYHIDLGEYYTYGIHVTGFNYSETLHDVSPHKEKVSRMVELFNREQLSPIHLLDVVREIIDTT